MDFQWRFLQPIAPTCFQYLFNCLMTHKSYLKIPSGSKHCLSCLQIIIRHFNPIKHFRIHKRMINRLSCKYSEFSLEYAGNERFFYAFAVYSAPHRALFRVCSGSNSGSTQVQFRFNFGLNGRKKKGTWKENGRWYGNRTEIEREQAKNQSTQPQPPPNPTKEAITACSPTIQSTNGFFTAKIPCPVPLATGARPGNHHRWSGSVPWIAPKQDFNKTKFGGQDIQNTPQKPQ